MDFKFFFNHLDLVCEGVLESPWYCNESHLSEDPRCKFMYSLNWLYNKKTSELEITTNFSRNSDSEIILVGLANKGKVSTPIAFFFNEFKIAFI